MYTCTHFYNNYQETLIDLQNPIYYACTINLATYSLAYIKLNCISYLNVLMHNDLQFMTSHTMQGEKYDCSKLHGR